MSRSEWWAYCVELDAEGETLQKIHEKSPNWDRNLPQVFVNTGITDPRVLFADGFSNAKKEDVARHGTRLREDILYKGGLTKEQALRTRSHVVEALRAEGFGVLNAKPRQTHRVYVIDLDPAVREESRVGRENPRANPEMPCVYVGETGKSLKKRRAEHRKGINAGRGYVTNYGFGRPFLYDLFRHLNPCLPEDALKHERELAEDLRARGYTVTGGH